MNRILFIDPGTTFGWAHTEQNWVESGIVNLSKLTFGQRVSTFHKWLEANIPGMSMEAVLFEECFQKGPYAAQVYGGWLYGITLICETHNIPYLGVNVNTIRAYARKQGFYNDKVVAKKSAKMGITMAVLLDKKPRPRPEWKLSALPRMQNNESDARWGLEYVLQEESILNQLGIYTQPAIN